MVRMMVASAGQFLVVGEDAGTARALQRALADWRCVSQPSGSPDPACEADLVFAALGDPEHIAHQLLRELRERMPHAPVILLGASPGGYSVAVRVGAFDYLRKPLEPDAVVLAVQRALAWRRLDLARQELERAVDGLQRRARETDLRDFSAAPCQALHCAVRERLSLRELSDRYIDAILQLTGGNKVRAAEILGIDRRTLYRRGRGRD
jgi:DNA-binding NtrC family response regulator